MNATVTRRHGRHWHVDTEAGEVTSERTASYPWACLAIEAARKLGGTVDVHCDCGGLDRYDVVVGCVTYRGALVQGDCGLFRRGLGQLAAWVLSRRLEGRSIVLYAHYCIQSNEPVMVSAVDVFAVSEHAEVQP